MAQKTVVTHISPDLDGIGAYWLLKKFHPDFKNARLDFVPAGQTYLGQPDGSNPNVIHVDTGMGRFDHHQSGDFTCAAKLVLESLVKDGYIKNDDALERLINVICELDHGWDNYKWSEAESDRYEFSLHNLLSGWKMVERKSDEELAAMAIFNLEAVYKLLLAKVTGEEELAGGEKFATKWGEGVAVYTGNSTVLDLGIKKGFAVVVVKDPKRGNVRVTGSNNKNVDLTDAYNKLTQLDMEGTWYLHPSKVLLRNGSSRNPQMIPTKLELGEIIEVLRKNSKYEIRNPK